ncbi:MAG: glycine--tRNA ligase subunit beta [Simkaniaceae bacterium]|nr:glycine--tRNA ligase subunit beta [Simkaniaceae bacterium]
MLTFQEIIHQLSLFWSRQGCAIQHGYDLEVGAGTFNPATVLRCLGPEPYNTVYVEPSRRPQDSRYGENPNRVHHFHQLQVLMKPSPLNIQALYLESLQSLGIDLSENDIRFVHDDWESPTLGAWGLGWEVWLNGMEITQFTYFQSVASHELSPIPVEITYGLERIAMALQQVDSLFDIKWNEHLSYGDIFHRSEVEWSHYNFNQASTEMWLRHFEDFEKEAGSLIDARLPIPAYDFVMKASHAFNILEARGVLSTTERVGYIARIRELSRLVATGYLSIRAEQKFPLLAPKTPPLLPVSPGEIPSSFDPHHKEHFLLEIGSEELPATFVPLGCADLEKQVHKLLTDHHLPFDKIRFYGTPRRLAVLVENLAEGTRDESLEKKGPSLEVAFDETGALTKQGAGFLKSIGLSEDTDQIEKRDGYLYAKVEKKGISTIALLAEHLPHLIASLHFPKKMRWHTYTETYARPIHWIVALYDKKVIPFTFAGVASDRVTYGHSQRMNKPLSLRTASDYVPLLKKNKVMVDILERKLNIVEQLDRIERDLHAQALEKTRVLKEVLHLTEWPELLLGNFSPKFLEAPKEVLSSEMVHHQRYFPLSSKDTLMNMFVITADNVPSEPIRQGNQRVLSARLSDGVFLFKDDLKMTLDQFNEKLHSIIFQKELGTLYQKMERVKELSSQLARHFHFNEMKAKRAAHLSKADLATELVGEFPDLQGVIGKHYALHQGEDSEVATAIEEHWMPTGEGGPLPMTETGIVVSLADKLDNLISYFGIGMKPSSSSDPLALRRQSIGLLKILIENKLSLNLSTLVSEEILLYLTQRAKGVLEEYGYKKDEIEASLQGKLSDPYDHYQRIKALHLFRKETAFDRLFEVYKRAKGQLGAFGPLKVNPSLLTEPSEKELYEYLESIDEKWKADLSRKEYGAVFGYLALMQKPLAHLFDTVKILAEEEAVKHNRIALLQRVFAHFHELLDFSKIQS